MATIEDVFEQLEKDIKLASFYAEKEVELRSKNNRASINMFNTSFKRYLESSMVNTKDKIKQTLRKSRINNSPPPNEYEITYDECGNEIKTKVSNLGGGDIDFLHYIGGENDGKTKVIDRSNGENTWVNDSSAFRGYQVRNSHTSWENIFDEWKKGTGPEKSLFIEINPSWEVCSLDGTCGKINGSIKSFSKYHNFYSSIGRKSVIEDSKPKDSIKIIFNLFDVPVQGDGWTQMIGSATLSYYKLGDDSKGNYLIMYMLQDSKSRKSFYYHFPVKNKNRSNTKATPEGNTYQTYIWFESISETERKYNQFSRVFGK